MTQNKHILGITGGVGSGKSTVLAYLAGRYGACVIQCDQVGFELERRGGPCFEPIVELLGEKILAPDGEIDRRKTAEIVFADPEKLSGLNAIVHPAVKNEVRRITKLVEKETPERLIVIEAALLFEDRYEAVCDEIWYIHTDASVRASRLRSSRGYSDSKIRDIMQAQKPDAFYESRADAVIDNSRDDPEFAYRQIDEGLTKHGFLYDSQREQR